jgi:hypothetical protein
MTSLLHSILLPITKMMESRGPRRVNARQIFGFDDWLNHPIVMSAAQRHPGFREDMDEAFGDLFRQDKTLNLNDFTLLLLRVKQKHGIRLEEALPSPFLRTTSPTGDYLTAYRHLIQPSLAKPLPLWLNGRTILGGDLESPSAITLAVLRSTEVRSFLGYAKIRATTLYGSGPHINYAIGEIVNGLIDAKRRAMNYFAWSG